jgi:hypothetical protein
LAAAEKDLRKVPADIFQLLFSSLLAKLLRCLSKPCGCCFARLTRPVLACTEANALLGITEASVHGHRAAALGRTQATKKEAGQQTDGGR